MCVSDFLVLVELQPGTELDFIWILCHEATQNEY